jgi:hypothetical protein
MGSDERCRTLAFHRPDDQNQMVVLPPEHA